MQTRIATFSDISQISKLLNSLFVQEIEFVPNKEKQENGLKMIIENPTLGHILVIEKSNKIIATINLLYTISTALGAKVAILEDMIVSSKFQKKGIGSKLLQDAINFAKQQKCQRITLLTDKNNILAHTFYTKNGFKYSEMIPFRYDMSTLIHTQNTIL